MISRRQFMRFLAGAAVAAPAAVCGTVASTDCSFRQASPAAGFQFHAGETVWAALRAHDPLMLRREPSNRYDRNAIAVYWRGRQLGYVPARENAELAALMDRGMHADS